MLVRPVAGVVETAVKRLWESNDAGPRASTWQAVYFYQAVPEEPLLCLELIPLMLEEMARGRIDAFFFIRYWEGGKHLRLRFRSEDPGVLERVRRGGWRSEAGRPQPLRVRPGEYEPEIDRYGGPACIGICEAHFMLSSFHVWSRLRPNLDLPPEDLQRQMRLPSAAHDMMMIVRHAFGEPETAIEFLRNYWNGWLLPMTARHDERARGLRGVLEREMARQFDHIGAALKTHLLRAWRACPDRVESAGSVEGGGSARYLPQAEWSAGTASVLSALREAGLDLASRAGMRTVSGLIHMNNNRFGVLNRDEAFLAYICQRTLLEAHT